MAFELRDYQVSVLDAVANHIKYRNGVHGYVTSPGGSGKSIMIARTAQFSHDLGKRVVILARSEKLLRQNRDKFDDQYQSSIGIYCAGLNAWDAGKPITIASIQSIANADNIPPFDIAFVDESHNIAPESQEESQYWRFFQANGNPQIIGFTATPFRGRSGSISWGEEIASVPIAPLFEAGYLCRPENRLAISPDVSSVQIRLGEFVESQVESLFLEPGLLRSSVEKIAQYSRDRNSVLIFTQSRKHSAVLKDAMQENGMPAHVVDGDTPKPELAAILADFEARRFKYLINCSLLTEGYDSPCIDMVAILRCTTSKAFFEQMVYRGTRPYPGKSTFTLADFGGNLERHGPLGSPWQGKGIRDARAKPYRVCPSCEDVTPIGKPTCVHCGYEFIKDAPVQVNHAAEADTSSDIVFQPIQTFPVTDVRYSEHVSRKKGTKSIKVTYYSPSLKYGNISEWIAPHSENDFARSKSHRWLKDRGWNPYGDLLAYTLDDILWHCDADLKKPLQISVDFNDKFPRIISYEWPETSRSSDSAGAGQVDCSDLLDGDQILF